MRKLFGWLAVGLILRLIVIPTALHPDFRAYNLAAYLISQKGRLLTFYDYISYLPRSDPLVITYGDGLFIYPPLAYLTHALFMAVLSPLYPWGAFQTLISDIGSVRTTAGFTPLMYLLKLPYLVADIAGLILIWRLVESRFRRLAVVLWWFNPVSVYTSYLLSQFDIFVAVFLLAAVLVFSRRPALAAILVGLAAGFKPFPLLLAPFLGQSLPAKIKSVLLAGLSFGLTIVPYLGSTAFKHYALLAPQSDKLWYAQIAVSGAQYLPVFFVGYFLLLWWNYYQPRRLPLWAWLATPLLLFYAVTHYHPQWLMWVTPFLLLAWIYKPATRLPTVILLAAYFILIFAFDSSLSVGLFLPQFSAPAWLSNQWASLVRAVFFSSSLALVMRATPLLPK